MPYITLSAINCELILLQCRVHKLKAKMFNKDLIYSLTHKTIYNDASLRIQIIISMNNLTIILIHLVRLLKT